MIPVRQQGLLAEISAPVLFYGALWVFLADGIFAALALMARTHAPLSSIAWALLLVAALLAAVFSRIASALASLCAAGIFGALIYHLSAIALLAGVVLVQFGLLHYVACSILRARWKRPSQTTFT